MFCRNCGNELSDRIKSIFIYGGNNNESNCYW